MSLTAYARCGYAGMPKILEEVRREVLVSIEIDWLRGHQIESKEDMQYQLIKAEYIAMSGCCAQSLRMRSQLKEYGFDFNKIPLYCVIYKVLLLFACQTAVSTLGSKNIDILHHFILRASGKCLVELYSHECLDLKLLDVFKKERMSKQKVFVDYDGQKQMVPPQPPIRTDEQIVHSLLSAIYLQQFWNTMKYNEKTGVYGCQVDEQWFDLCANLLRKALAITPVNPTHPFELHHLKAHEALAGPDPEPMKEDQMDADYGKKLHIQVPTAVDKYLGTKLDDALLKNQESKKSPKEIYQNKKGNRERNQDSTYSIRNTANYHLYHALMEALIADEDAMDKEVANKVKDHKRGKQDCDEWEDDDDVEGPSAGSTREDHRSDQRRSLLDFGLEELVPSLWVEVNAIMKLVQSMHHSTGGLEERTSTSTNTVEASVVKQSDRDAKFSVLLISNIRVNVVFHYEDGNPARANIKQALGYLKDGDGDGINSTLRYSSDYIRTAQTRLSSTKLAKSRIGARVYASSSYPQKTVDNVSYDCVVYDSLVQFEPHVLASKAKKAAKNHDLLALISHSNASSSQSHANSSYSPQPYYVTHPSSVVDYKDEYQGELQGDSQEDKLTTAMMLLVEQSLKSSPYLSIIVFVPHQTQGIKP
ncbi:hypothetical protein Tco_0674433 [Tanacetum coccineum]